MPDAGRQGPTLPNSPPQFPLSDANIDVLFGGEDSQMGYQNDPYGLLDCPMVSETPRCTLYAIFQRRQGSSPSNELNTAGASATVDPVLDSTPLADDHETKFLEEARLQFTSERSSFVRLNALCARRPMPPASRYSADLQYCGPQSFDSRQIVRCDVPGSENAEDRQEENRDKKDLNYDNAVHFFFLLPSILLLHSTNFDPVLQKHSDEFTHDSVKLFTEVFTVGLKPSTDSFKSYIGHQVIILKLGITAAQDDLIVFWHLNKQPASIITQTNDTTKMDVIENLLRQGLSWSTVENIISARQPAKFLLLLGLSRKTVKCLVSGTESFALKGTKHTRKVADLRSHHLTRKDEPWYAFRYRAVAAREASKVLENQRSEWVASGIPSKFIPLPGWVRGKQTTRVRGPRVVRELKTSPLSNEVVMEDSRAILEADYSEMQEFWRDLCDFGGNGDTKTGDPNDDIYRGGFDNEAIGSALEFTNSNMESLDDYDIEMAKAEEGLFGEQPEQTLQIPGQPTFNSVNNKEPGRQTKRKRDSRTFSESYMFDLPGEVDHDDKRRPPAEQWNLSPISRAGRDRQTNSTKRKRESTFSPQSPILDLPGDSDHEEKRRKLEEGETSFQAPPASPQSKGSRKGKGKLTPLDLFCQGTIVSNVFQAMEAVSALETPQEDSSDAREADAPNSKQIIAEALYPKRGEDEIRVTKAAAILLEVHQDSSSLYELDPADREALKEVFGSSDKLQPSVHTKEEPLPFVTMIRTATPSERSYVNKSLMRRHSHSFQFDDKPTEPSEKFRSFFATPRRREALLLQGEESWNEADASFIRTGKKIAEPGARLGAECVAKRLLDGRKTPLKELVRDSQMSTSQRRKQALLRPDVEKLSRKEERKVAQMKKSGLNKREKD
ncbi:MAG: hypothetical protein ASARMPREDX12_000021 [Alectoria sarmentosa]|nr:MAG: hypothetical protein ASARMPREDX12_000021 [Alectoria sarmentosa]